MTEHDTTGHDPHERALANLMRSVRAESDPVLWTRVRARLASADEPGVLGWLMRPAALAASAVALVVASLTSMVALRDALPPSFVEASGLTEALLDVDRSPLEGLVIPSEADGVPADSGARS